jgi:hypothetical protein
VAVTVSAAVVNIQMTEGDMIDPDRLMTEAEDAHAHAKQRVAIGSSALTSTRLRTNRGARALDARPSLRSRSPVAGGELFILRVRRGGRALVARDRHW